MSLAPEPSFMDNMFQTSVNMEVHEVSSSTSPFQMTPVGNRPRIGTFSMDMMDNTPSKMLPNLKSLSLEHGGREGRSTNKAALGPFLLKLLDVPATITKRECYAVFALSSDLVGIEIVKPDESSQRVTATILATFNTLHLVVQYAKILGSKDNIFGPELEYKPKLELVDKSTQTLIDYHDHDLFHENSRSGSIFKNFHASASSSSSSASTMNAAGMFSQRSRFSFADPFTSDPLSPSYKHSMAGYHPHHHAPSNIPQQNSMLVNGNSSFHDLDSAVVPHLARGAAQAGFATDNTDTVNNSIWGSSSFQLASIGFSNGSQISGSMNDWDANQNRNQNVSMYSPTPGPNGSDMAVTAASSTIVSGSSMDPTPIPLFNQPAVENNMNAAISGPKLQFPTYHMDKNTADVIEKSEPNSFYQKQSHTHEADPTRKMLPKNPTNIKVHKAGDSQNTMSQADLTLLAKIPPPANPADQNPPCNTLYVGNLPSNATEQELRELFSTQDGFRRLSFKNKTSAANSHGPICFVEFEDVSYATRALAELYGRQLPHSSMTNKGGIRLSFSKNPLGVRGPTNSRRSNGNLTAVSSASNTNNTAIQMAPLAYSYVGGYSKN